MKTSKNNIIVLALAASFLVATNVRADFVNLTFTTDRTNYLGGVHGSDWNFTSVGKHDGQGNGNGGPWTQWAFNIENELGDKTTGSIFSDNFNGNGKNGEGRGTAAVNTTNGTASMSHNSANNFTISFTDSFVDSFYIALTPWSSYSAADAFNLTVNYWDSNNVLQTEKFNQTFTDSTPFLGFILDGGAFLESVWLGSIGTPNNGYNITGMGFGNNGFNTFYPEIILPPSDGGGSDVTTPEPATLAMIGLGLAGLGIARRRMKK